MCVSSRCELLWCGHFFSDGRRTDGLSYVEKTDLIVFEEARFIRMHARVDFRLLYKTKSTLVYG